MTKRIWAMVGAIRREAVAWLLVGAALHWAWLHGPDKWAAIMLMGAAGIHPGKSIEDQ